MSSSLKDIRFSKALRKNFFYVCNTYTQQEFKKEFGYQKNNFFGTTHVKKIATSIDSYFLQKLSKFAKPYYLDAILATTIEDISTREKLFEELFTISYSDFSILKEIRKLQPFSYTYSPFIQAYTTEEKIQSYFLEEYNISLLLLTTEELEETAEMNPQSILVTDSYAMCFDTEYKPLEFEDLLRGLIYENQKKALELLTSFLEKYTEKLEPFIEMYAKYKNTSFQFPQNILTLSSYLSNQASVYQRAKNVVEDIKEKVSLLNEKISYDLKKQTISLSGDEIVALLEQKATSSLQEKISLKYKEELSTITSWITDELRALSISPKVVFSQQVYPYQLDETELDAIVEEATSKGEADKQKKQRELGSQITFDEVDELFDALFFIEFLLVAKEEFTLENYHFVNQDKALQLINLRHFFISNPTPVSYALKSFNCNGTSLDEESVALVTGANSGGKTTLVESIIQATILSSRGFPCKLDKGSSIPNFKKVIYLKKFTGTQGSGAFEQTLKQLLDLLEEAESNVLIVIDELEAVTEPGAAAKILLLFLKELAKQDKYCITITHLGEELEHLVKEQHIENLRIDGISAQGLDEKGNLLTDHQPQFYSRGKSTPELIMKRVLQDNSFWKDKSPTTKELFTSLINQ